LRILHVAPFYAPAPGFGGMARAAAALAKEQAARDHEVLVLTARLDGSPAADEERAGGLVVRRLGGPLALAVRLVPWGSGVRRQVAETGGAIEVAHVHGHRTPLAVRAAMELRRRRIPYVFQPHGTFRDHGRHRLVKLVWDRTLGDALVAGAAATLAVSHAECADLPAPAEVVGNGVVAPGAVPHQAKRVPNRLLFVGSDSPQKRADVLPALLDALPSASLDLVGPIGPTLLERFARFGRRVRAQGPLDDARLAEAYAGAQLLVQPGVREAFGLVAFEAALFGTPAVVAGGHGAGEWYGKAGGCVVPPDDARSLAAAVAERLAQPELCAREAERVARFASGELTWARVADRVDGLLARVAAARAA
jgi:glycosyltransferase involved in cell wall biosynthesis